MAVHPWPELNPGARRKRSTKQLLIKPVLFFIALAMSGTGQAQSGSGGNLATQVQIQVVKLSLEDLSTDKVVIGVGLQANSKRNVTVDKVLLSGLRVNGVPVYAAPLNRRFKLRSNAAVSLPEPLRITVYLRDLDSLEPLRNAISDGDATVDGVAVIHVPLNPFARLMLLSKDAEVTTALHQQVVFGIPGGPLAAASLVKILDLAEAASKALDSALAEATKLSGRRSRLLPLQ